MSKHTPGPWKVIDNGHNGYRVGTDKRDGHDTCTVQSVYTEGNARLIAAAPDMLIALRDASARWYRARIALDGEAQAATERGECVSALLQNALNMSGETERIINAAIAKAEGTND